MNSKTEKEVLEAPATEPDGKFTEKIGRTTFEVAVFFNKHSKMTAEDRLKRLIRDKVESGSF